jgi:hypothetical protein
MLRTLALLGALFVLLAAALLVNGAIVLFILREMYELVMQ